MQTLHHFTLSAWLISIKLYREEDLTQTFICIKLQCSSSKTTISMLINDMENTNFPPVDPFPLDLFSPNFSGLKILSQRLFVPSLDIFAIKLRSLQPLILVKIWTLHLLTSLTLTYFKKNNRAEFFSQSLFVPS